MLSIGLMSGTSMDGIDAALIETDGKTAVTELGDTSLSYDIEFRILLKAAEFAVRQKAGDLTAAKLYYPEAIKDYLATEFGILSALVPKKLHTLSLYFHGNENTPITFDEIIRRSTELHAKAVNNLLNKTQYPASKIDVIGYHGQTLFHRPSEKITIQIGSGSLLAKLTGITVINDFRSRDIHSGGQGAPFAPLYHQALAIRDKKYPVVVVNCGGIANVTVITGETDTDISGFDTGPGNGLVDRFVRQCTQGKEHMDTNGQYGSKGTINATIFDLLYKKAITTKEKNFFALKPPKSLDIGDLHLIPELNSLSVEDACATLEAFTADTIVNSTHFFACDIPTTWILTGGGWKNPVIRRELDERLKKKIGPTVTIITADEAGWNSQAMEAQIFAYLAVRSFYNLPISLPGTTRVPKPLTGGYINLPSTL